VWRLAAGVPAVATLLGAVGLVSPSPASAVVLGCGATITQNTTLTANVGPCTTPGQDGVTIAANGITLNLNGFSVIGNLATIGTGTTKVSTEGIGIRFNRTVGSTVTNGGVTGFQAGVVVDGGSANVVKKVNAHNNVGTNNSDYGDGIALDGATRNNQVTNNHVSANGPYSGISMLFKASSNSVSGNTVDANNIADVSSTTGANVDQVDMGIRVEGPSATNNNVTNNRVSGSGAQGIMVLPVCHDAFAETPTCAGDVANAPTLISGNTVNANGFGRTAGGIALFGMGLSIAKQPTKVTVINNRVTGNAGDGIRLQSNGGACVGGAPATQCAPFNNKVSNNTISQNQANGILLQVGSHDNVVAQNTLTYNSVDGLNVATGAVDNTLRGNTGNHNVVYDGFDGNPSCDANAWHANVFNTVNQPCVATP
jgi:parallel beta-helix repeat protein